MSVDGRSATAIEAPPSSVRVLVAEDDADVRGSLSERLTTCGHVVVGEATTMSEVFERAHALSPDVVLLDAHLGPTKMLEAAKTLAHDNPGVAVIFLCGESTFTLEGDVAGTMAISVLPSSSPAFILDSSVRLAAQRTRELCSAREEVVHVRQQLENR